MLSIILKRNVEPDEIQLTQYSLIKEMWNIKGAELLTEDSWGEGLKKVRTPFVCLVEGDCVLSADYLKKFMEEDNALLRRMIGGHRKLALASPVVEDSSRNRTFGYRVEDGEVLPAHQLSTSSYHSQIGFVPGAIIRYAAVKDYPLSWDEPDLVKLSTEVSIYIWSTNNRVKVNPSVCYFSNYQGLHKSHPMQLVDKVKDIFERERL